MLPIRAVIDTNVALDLLAFVDSRVDRLRLALEAGDVIWLASAHMRNEFAAVVTRLGNTRTDFDTDRLLFGFDAMTQLLQQPSAAQHVLRCRDADDQAFIDFALTHQADELISHDRDLLALARRAIKLGLTIRRP